MGVLEAQPDESLSNFEASALGLWSSRLPPPSRPIRHLFWPLPSQWCARVTGTVHLRRRLLATGGVFNPAIDTTSVRDQTEGQHGGGLEEARPPPRRPSHIRPANGRERIPRHRTLSRRTFTL